jgi:hypothetical protein
MLRRWPISHIFDKSPEIFQPAIANAYPATTILEVGFVLRIEATLFNVVPNPVIRMRSALAPVIRTPGIQITGVP